MARPQKSGMDYFPHDTDSLANDKIMIMRTLHGNDAYIFYFGLLECIYKTPGFEYDISDEEIIRVLCRKLAVSRRKFDAMLASALKYGCFDKKLYQSTGRLSSPGIKRRAEAASKPTPEAVQQTIPETLPVTAPITPPITLPITAPITPPITLPITTPETPQSKGKKREDKRIQPPTPSHRGVRAGESSEYNAEGMLDQACLTGIRNAVREQTLQAWLTPKPDSSARQAVALWLSPMARGPDEALGSGWAFLVSRACSPQWVIL
jgi:hypothetical protein